MQQSTVHKAHGTKMKQFSITSKNVIKQLYLLYSGRLIKITYVLKTLKTPSLLLIFMRLRIGQTSCVLDNTFI